MTSLQTRFKPRLVTAAFLLIFCSPTLTLPQQDPGGLDVSLFREINNHRSHFLDNLVDVNNDVVFPLGVFVPAGFLSYGLLTNSDYETDTGVLLTVSEIMSYGLSFGLKKIVRRERPYATLTNVHLPGGRLRDPNSFPSSHSTTAFAIATTLSLRYPEMYVYIPLHLWALFVAYGRVYLGVHYPSDVIVGAAIGSGTAIAIHLLEDKILKLKRRVFGGTGDEGQLERASVVFLPLKSGGLLKFSYRF